MRGVSVRLMRIESTANDRVKAVRRLHRGRERQRTGKTLVEGPALIEAALAGGIVPEDVFAVEPGPLVERCEAAGSRVFEVSAGVLKVLATTVEPQDPVAVIPVPPDRDLEVRQTLVAVEVGDPGNLGTLIRTAAALGWQAARIGGADPWSPKVLRASAGAQLTAPAIASTGLEELVEMGFAPIATIASGGGAPEAIAAREPIALLVGSEAHGLPRDMVERCRAAVTIPMTEGFESLNAAVAGAIAMYALGSESRKGKIPRQ